MEMGLPFLPAGVWADLKAFVPGPENLPYPKTRFKPTAAFQVVPGNCATDMHTRTNFNIKNCLELYASAESKPESNFIDFISQRQVVSCWKVKRPYQQTLSNLLMREFMKKKKNTEIKTHRIKKVRTHCYVFVKYCLCAEWAKRTLGRKL